MLVKEEILIVGERLLVEEYASLCSEKGFAIDARVNGNRSGAFPKNVTFALELTNIDVASKKKNLVQLDRSLAEKTTIISSSTTVTVAEQTGWVRHPERLIGIGALPTLLGGSLIELAASQHSTGAATHSGEVFVKSIGKECAFIKDSVGLVMPRILCALANEACFAMMEGVADGSSIDAAMRLGTNYPRGPVAWAEAMGMRHVLAVLDALHAHFREERYRAAPLIRQRAMEEVQSRL